MTFDHLTRGSPSLAYRVQGILTTEDKYKNCLKATMIILLSYENIKSNFNVKVLFLGYIKVLSLRYTKVKINLAGQVRGVLTPQNHEVWQWFLLSH